MKRVFVFYGREVGKIDLFSRWNIEYKSTPRKPDDLRGVYVKKR